MSRNADIVSFSILGVTILLIIMFMFLPLVLETRRNKAYKRRAASKRNIESRAPQSLPSRQLPTGGPIQSDIPLLPQQNARTATTAPISHDLYDSRYTYTRSRADTWIGDGGICPHR